MNTLMADDARAILGKYILTDGYPFVADLDASEGSWLVDACSGERYLDFFSFFASLPLGFNHPCFTDAESRERLLGAAVHKVSNSDIYTDTYASFVKTFAEIALPSGFRHLFFIEGGALAVENALKTAFDWKVRKNIEAGRPANLGTRVLHFREAFHGRSGYTLSLTNTDPTKTDYFPKFDWPRVSNPKIHFPINESECKRVAAAEQETLAAIEEEFRNTPHDIAAIIIEPIQGEGGDNHFRPDFLRALREVADREEALLIFDEVQTGMGLTGKMWAFQNFDVVPDIVAFGKKSQVCGIMVSDRVSEVPENVFEKSSRINSTWGGNLVDMARCELILKVIRDEHLVANAREMGTALFEGLHETSESYPDFVTNVRGLGLMCAFDLPTAGASQEVVRRCLERKLIVLPCGSHSVRLRPALTVSEDEIDHATEILADVFSTLAADFS